MKLEIELVPQGLWRSSLANLFSRSEWDRIRKEQYKKANYKCEICGTEDVLNCHEKWYYDDEKRLQTLTGFIALCRNCHAIKHAGFSMHTEKGKQIFNREELIKHFCKVNNCSKEDFLKHEDEAFEVWSKRSKQKWSQDFGVWNKFIKNSS